MTRTEGQILSNYQFLMKRDAILSKERCRRKIGWNRFALRGTKNLKNLKKKASLYFSQKTLSLLPIDITDAIPLIGKPTNQSSTHVSDSTATSTSDKAVDGNTDGNYFDDSCIHTAIGKTL